MILRFILIFATIFAAIASNDDLPPQNKAWPFSGLFGTVDRQAAQRGFQVYKQVCSACHSMNYLYYRNLKSIGFSDAEIKEIAKEYTIKDGPNDQGEMFERIRIPSDAFAAPFNNEQAARAANNGAYPPDLSLIIKARQDGANYLYSLLTGYRQAPKDFALGDGLYYNPYFHGKQIAMPAPLYNDIVSYSDGTAASVDQMAKDVVVFLQWAAEPEMEHRKSAGLKVMFFLVIFTIISYITKNRIWSRLN